MEKNRTKESNSAIIGIYNLLLLITIISVLYFGQDILIPLATAALLTFLFSPIINYLEAILGRIASISIIVCLLFLSTGVISYTFYKQIINFSNELPSYSENIRIKSKSLQEIFSPLLSTIEDITNQKMISDKQNYANDNLVTKEKPIAVKVINEPIQSTGFYTAIFGSVFNFLGNTILVMILIFFMLYYREDLHGRILHLISKGKISAAKEAIEDASNRVTKYLLALFIVNIFYGLSVTLALFIIGIPNAALWGIMGGVLRFIPYVGFVFSAFIPIILSLIISTDFIPLLETIGFFAVIELIISYLIEPLFYGNRTGTSPLALIIAAIFWTWLWGMMGLVLAVPLTVCLVVIGRHVPRFESFSDLLGDEIPLQLHENLYYRILGGDLNYAFAFIENYLKDHTLVELYDNILIPMIVAAEKDYLNESLTYEQKEWVFQTINDIINEMYARADDFIDKLSVDNSSCKIICFGARAERDDISSQILAQLLTKLNLVVTYIPAKDITANLKDIVDQDLPNLICISVVSPTSIMHAKYICSKLRKNYSNIKIIVGLWNHGMPTQDEIESLKASGANEVITTMEQAIKEVAAICHSTDNQNLA